MVEAPKPREVHHTSISYVYKVFQHLDMLWIDVNTPPLLLQLQLRTYLTLAPSLHFISLAGINCHAQ